MACSTRSGAVTLCALLCLLAAPAPAPAQESGEEGTGYTVKLGTNQDAYKWTDLSRFYMLSQVKNGIYPDCIAGRQSPINIDPPSAQGYPGGISSLSLEYDGKNTRPVELKLKDNGHTLELAAETANSVVWSRVRNDDAPGGTSDISYALKQIHFHHPSEHLVRGRRYPMEIHFVHRQFGAEGGVPLVVAVFLEVVANPPGNASLQSLFRPMVQPAKLDNWGYLDSDRTFVSLKSLIPANRTLVSYWGSFTTPPCDQHVIWAVFTTPLQVSQAQVDRFKSYYLVNARPVQQVQREQRGDMWSGNMPDK